MRSRSNIDRQRRRLFFLSEFHHMRIAQVQYTRKFGIESLIFRMENRNVIYERPKWATYTKGARNSSWTNGQDGSAVKEIRN